MPALHRRFLSAGGVQPFRPLLHLLAFYPLLLVVPVGLLLLAWGVLMSEYDAFHQLWNERPLGGVMAGALFAIILGEVMLATFLIDRERRAQLEAGAAAAPDPEAALALMYPPTPWWGYWSAWGILLLLAVLPPQLLLGSEFRVDRGDDAAKAAAALGRLWFPLGILIAVAGFVLLRGFSGAFRSPGRFGAAIVTAFGTLYFVTCFVHFGSGGAYLDWLPAGVCVLLFLGFVAGLFAVFTRMAGRTPFLYPGLIATLVVPFVIPSCQTRYHLPHMEVAGAGKSYYDEPARLANYPAMRTPERAAAARLVNDRAALDNWHKRMLEVYDNDPQPIVLVTVSGGASASAVYCADVLFTLEEEIPGFANRVRLVSGASGGMLGAAYFVTQLRAGGLIASARERPEYQEYLKARKHEDATRTPESRAAVDAAKVRYDDLMRQVRADFFRGLHHDFLSPVMQKWVHRDLPLAAFGRPTTNDRGYALESAWHRHLGGALDVPIRALRDEEAAGKIPSLVFTPMMIEDGRQLIISNLDLDYMVETARMPGPDGVVAPMSFMGVEFFRLFPKADEFRLSTAVRMSASFPYLSPSAALPTDPIRHVVDAGYYDNYGTTVATKWVTKNTEWIAGDFADAKQKAYKPPEVIMLRIRCFGYERSRFDIVTEKETAAYGREVGSAKAHKELVAQWAEQPPATPVHTERGMFSLTSPLFGLFSSWRANMVYRADERLGGAHTALKVRPEVVLNAYPIECDANPSLNWVLSAGDLANIHDDVRRNTKDQLRRVLDDPNFRRSESNAVNVIKKSESFKKSDGASQRNQETTGKIAQSPGLSKTPNPELMKSEKKK